MKHNHLTILFFMLMSMMGFKSFAQTIIEVKNAEGKKIWYSIKSYNEVEVYWNTKIKGDLVIPASVQYKAKSYKVTSITKGAFWGNNGLTSVTIPNSVDSIGPRAFSGCRRLTSVTILNDVVSIGFCAFSDCRRLTSVTLQNGVKSVGELAFAGCNALTKIVIPNVKYIDQYAFKDCNSLISVTIPNGTSIGKYAIPDDVQIIRCAPDAIPLLIADNLSAEENKQQSVKENKQQSVKENKQHPVKEPDNSMKSDVDLNIPIIRKSIETTFVVIIGNEKYNDEEGVPYAENDANIFGEYCQKTLGISEKHIRLVINAGYNDIRKAVNWLKQGMDAYGEEGRIIFYYAGHGIPCETDRSAYLLPVDGLGSDIGSAYSLAKLYQTLSELPAQSVTIFLDACFSGAKRDGQMMASARGVAIKAKAAEAQGKMVVFSAAQGDETAYPYSRQQHGLFTYYLLKKLQESKGDVTLGDLADYLTREVKRESFDENNKLQTPTVNVSAALADSWREMKLK